MNQGIKERLVQLFDHARSEGMLHSKDGIHSDDSDYDAEEAMEAVQPLIDQARQEGGRAALVDILLSLDMAEDENGFVSISNHYPWADLQPQLNKWLPTEKKEEK